MQPILKRLLGAAAFGLFVVGAGPASAIVGGTAVDGMRYPWQVRLFDSEDRSSGFCGGALITDRWVLTMGYCVRVGADVVPALSIGFGSTAQSELTLVRSETVVVHPDGEVALIKLAAPATGAGTIRIPDPEREASLLKQGAAAIATGWGATWDYQGFEAAAFGSETLSPDGLRAVELPLVAPGRCRDAYKRYGDATGTTYEIRSHEFCAGDPFGGKDTCYGDSGGPLAMQAGGSWYLVGLVSWGSQCGNPGLPGVFARPSVFLDWITGTIRWESDDAELAADEPAARPRVSSSCARTRLATTRSGGRDSCD